MYTRQIRSVCHILVLVSFFLGGERLLAAGIEDRPIYFDNDGLIVHMDKNGHFDGGDTAQREGWYWFGVWIRQNTPGLPPWQPTRRLNFDQVLKLLEPNGDGVFYRHPKLPPWNDPFSKEWGTSRDQLVPLIAAMGVWGKTEELKRLWNALPEDIVGKHAFNGNWRNFLGQDGPNCGDIKKRGCDATADCSLKQDDRDCTLQVDKRDCSLAVDTRNCGQPHDERSCSVCIVRNIFTGGCSQTGNDPLCEIAKAGQNKIYDATGAACEAAKAAQNTAYQTAKATCEAEKASQNAGYAGAKASCESGKAAQNALYKADKAACESAKTGKKYACEVDKQAAYQSCRLTNVFSGDIIGPSTTNLFRRALNQDPMVPDINNLLPSTIVQSGAQGEAELLANTIIRIRASHLDPDDVGDDLNHIVHLIMAKLRYPTLVSDAAVHQYAALRANSYGSYLGTYYAHPHDADMADVKQRIVAGIASGWAPDVSAPYGAVRWYHLPSFGANPQLATLYSVIIDMYIK
ncbi:hypothetical protein [Paraburkholderia sp. 35.1]|uniref:hypothetical protein n=1 Tax=Paraburkholderia sp. 35.1 TaxID=2991058 RepID=UPI003D1AF9BC